MPASKVHVTRLPRYGAADRSREWSVGVMDLTEDEARMLERVLYEGINAVKQIAAEQASRRNMASVAAPGAERDEALRRLLGERINAATDLRDKLAGADIAGLTKPKPKTIEPDEPQQGNRLSGLDI